MSASTSQTSDSLSDLYFTGLTHALKNASVYQPTLVVDKERLDQNIQAVKSIIERGFDFRIVAKSLPSVPMLKYIMAETGSNRLMSFHMPFLRYVCEHIPNADVLMGKPMPIGSVLQFYKDMTTTHSEFKPEAQLQWLIDSYERVCQYGDLAETQGLQLRVSLELDVGLHRGGFSELIEFEKTLSYIKNHPNLQLSGLMGYEAHVTKIPGFLGGPIKAFKKSFDTYKTYVKKISDIYCSGFLESLTLNTGGSSTYPLYDKPGVMNEIATASALVKPSDFDVFTLDHHLPAAFIAAPVLKIVHNPEIPMAKPLSKCMRALGLLPQKACFIYGGNWLARPVFPAGSKISSILGHSSNQEMYELKASDTIKIDDFMFFRPTQSEAVFLQFGEIAVYDKGEIVDWWSVFESKRSE